MLNEKMRDDLATPHIFGGAHYSVMSVDGWFPRDTLEIHFRRHFEKMGLTAQFEFGFLLAFSSKITKARKPLETWKASEYAQAVRADSKANNAIWIVAPLNV